jgi:signal peptidase
MTHRSPSGKRLDNWVLLAVIASITSALVSSSPAQAAETMTIVRSDYLTLTSIGNSEEMDSLSAGRPVFWQVGVQANTPELSSISIGVSATGLLAEDAGLQLQIRVCTLPWVHEACSGTESLCLANQAVADVVDSAGASGIRVLSTMPSSEQRWLLIQITLPTAQPQGTQAEMSIHASGFGDTIETGQVSGESLAATGANCWPALGIAAAPILVGIGLATIARRRTRGRVRERPQ